MELFACLVLSIISILSLLIGSLIVFSTKNNSKVTTFSVSLGFIVLILLGLFHLVPEAFEYFSESAGTFKATIFTISFSILGFGLIIATDVIGGHHKEKNEETHYKHISLITCAVLVLHNFIEGMTLYTAALSSVETAVILSLGICLHNIPLGFTLSSTFDRLYGKSKTVLYIILIGSSYLFGTLILYRFNQFLLNNLVLGSFLSLTFGMIVYIALFEFLPLLKESKDKKTRNIALLLGIVLMILTLFM